MSGGGREARFTLLWLVCVKTKRCLTVLRPQQTVEHLLDDNRVEFDQLGKSLDDFVLHRENRKTTCKYKEIAKLQVFTVVGCIRMCSTFSRPLMTGIRKRTSGTRLW